MSLRWSWLLLLLSIALLAFTYTVSRDKGMFLLDLVVTAAVAMPVVWFILWRERRRLRALQAANCCLHCGYNLTGNTSGVCPECGTSFMKPQIDADARR